VKRGNCRACREPLGVLPLSAPALRAVSVRLTVRAPGLSRIGDFELCRRCVEFPDSAERAMQVQAALMAELRTLLAV